MGEELPRELERARRMGTGLCVAMIDLPACALEDAVRIVERLRAVTPLVTCSVGLACWDFQEAGMELVARADQALYAAKAGGGNRSVLASP